MRVKRNFLPSGDQDRCWIKSPILETRTGGGSSDWAQVRPKPVDGSTAARSQTPCRNGLRMISCSSFPTLPRLHLGAKEIRRRSRSDETPLTFSTWQVESLSDIAGANRGAAYE